MNSIRKEFTIKDFKSHTLSCQSIDFSEGLKNGLGLSVLVSGLSKRILNVNIDFKKRLNKSSA